MLPPTIKLSNVHIADHLSYETTAFTAQLELAGQNIGRVRNDGTGGSHAINIAKDGDRTAFDALVADWAAQQRVTFEAADRLINALLDHYELTVSARAYARRIGCTEIVCIRKAPFRLDSEPIGYPLSWDETHLLPVPEGDTAEAIAAREQADAYITFSF